MLIVALSHRLSLPCSLTRLHLDLHIMLLEELYQGLFDYLTLSMQVALGLYGVNL